MSPALARRTFTLLCAFAAAGSMAYAETPVRITDLRPDGESGVPNLDAAVFADKLYFAGMDDSVNRDLWVYDGISPAALVPGGEGVEPEQLTVWQGALYFEGGPFEDRELWRYDGVNPPVEVLDLLGGGSGKPTNLTALGPELCFSATTGAVGDELVCWDGATAPDVYELRTGEAGGSPEAMTAIGSTLYFGAFADGLGREPFAYENFFPPELVGDVRAGLGSSLPESFAQLGTTLFFRASDTLGQGRVWSADGVSPPTQVSLLLDVEGGVATWHNRLLAVGSLDDPRAPLGGIAQLHVLRAGEFARTPWDGGSVLGATGFHDHRNALYFRAGGSVTASDLFRYCGGGVVERVMDQFADSSYITSKPVLFQGRFYFSAFEAATGQELWAVDPMTAVLCDGFEDGDLSGWSASAP